MEEQSTAPARWKRQLAWRVAELAQGVALVAVACAGVAVAVSMDRSGLQAPESGRPPEPHRLFVPAAHAAAPPNAWVFYIVASEEAAAVLRDALAAGNNIRHSVGLDFLKEHVLVAASPNDAELLAERLYEGNRILAAFRVEDRVINLVS